MSKEARLIAVVDDEEPIRKALSRLLRLAGLKVETFASGIQFLESVRTHTPDCLVLDLHMPETDGFQVESQLAHAGFRIPIVAITGCDAPNERERMTARGVAAFLHKPLDGQALLAAVTTATERSQA
ncbi:MAG: response regulator [Verrucomicrobia bacterium]|nr:response regulator [Verrucomicrobiota bacterium]